MGKFAEFMDKVMADETARAEFDAVIGVRKERELSDDDFQKIVGLSEKLGAAVMLDEVKDFFSGNGRELSEEELAGVAGGYGEPRTMCWLYKCPMCGEEFYCTFYVGSSGFMAGVSGVRIELKHSIEAHLRAAHRDICGNSRLLNEFIEQKAEEMLQQSDFEKITTKRYCE